MSQTDDLQQALKAIQDVFNTIGIDVDDYEVFTRIETSHAHFYVKREMESVVTTSDGDVVQVPHVRNVTVKFKKGIRLRSAGFRDWTHRLGTLSAINDFAMFGLYCRSIKLLSDTVEGSRVHKKFSSSLLSMVDEAVVLKALEVITLAHSTANIKLKGLTMYSPDIHSNTAKTAKEVIGAFYPTLTDNAINAKAVKLFKKAERIYDINCRSTVPTASENA